PTRRDAWSVPDSATVWRAGSPRALSATSSPNASAASANTSSGRAASMASSISAVWLRHSCIDENVCRAAGDQALEDILDAAELRMGDVDLDIGPRLDAERAGAFVRAVTEERLRREDVPAAGLSSRDPLELAQLLERVDPHVRVRPDADADRARAHALDREEAVAEVRLGRRACADARAGPRDQIELVAVRVRRVDDGRPLRQTAGAVEELDRPHTVLRETLL